MFSSSPNIISHHHDTSSHQHSMEQGGITRALIEKLEHFSTFQQRLDARSDEHFSNLQHHIDARINALEDQLQGRLQHDTLLQRHIDTRIQALEYIMRLGNRFQDIEKRLASIEERTAAIHQIN
jgi:hypothetical protein